MMPVQPSDFTNEELRQAVIEQHRDCPTCHPELGRDWLRAGTWGAALAGSLLFWGWVIGHLAECH